MHIRGSFLALAILLSAVGPGVQAQQSDPTQFDKTFQSAFAKAKEACKTLWSDRAFDTLRVKIPLGEDKPTFEMLKNAEKLGVKDRPLADLAIRTLDKCRAAYTDVYAMLPPQVTSMIHGVERRQDALVADLYRGKLSFGEFNTSMSRMTGELALALSGVQTQPNSPAPRPDVGAVPKATPQPDIKRKEPDTVALSHETRLALVIGNSGYVNLPKLSNPVNDALAIADVLGKMGYQTRLLLDGSEQKIRREVRQFASDSTKADVALVYYAGHGAQINGNNYLLPTDIDIPRTDVDIQFAGLKVDDLVNSIASNTKIIFLDACRDNPALFKNLVKGRGSSPAGLAPASSSNFEQKPGGGVFIAYATDAGAVADDGNGSHSPFTQALLRNMQKPISIDDMFSFVTKEVRLVTKNAQRPYKYASLENIVCVAPNCSTISVTPTKTDIFQQAVQSEADELQIALQTNNSEALETFLLKYPDSARRSEVQRTIETLKRSEFTEWTLYEIGGQHLPQYVQLSSIQRIGDRGVAKTKHLLDSTKPTVLFGKSFPGAAYQEQIQVFDCTTPTMASAEDFVFNETGELLFHYKWGDPKYLKISSLGFEIQSGSIGQTGRTMTCDAALSTPMVSKKQMAKMDFTSLSSMLDGNGEIFYAPPRRSRSDPNQLEVITIFKNFSDRNVKEFFPAGVSIPDPPNYREEVDLILLRCDSNKFAITRTEHWDASNRLVRMGFVDPAHVNFSEVQPSSPAAAMQEIFCQKGYAGIGIRLADNQGSAVVAEIFEGSPAARAGIAVNDIISQIDNEPLSGLPPQQITEKIRGPEGTKILLKVLRKGQDSPIEFLLTRAIVTVKSVEGGSK